MKRFFSDLRFYESYSFAQAISNILYNQFEFLRGLDEFYGDGQISYFAKPFPKYSALHSFIEFIVVATLIDENAEVDLSRRQTQIRNYGADNIGRFGWFPQKLPIDLAFEFYEIGHKSFGEWLSDKGCIFLDASSDDISEFLDDLQFSDEWYDLLEKIVREVFFILFQNRRLLLTFNEMMANQIKSTEPDEIPQENRGYFTERSGILRRASIPEWVKKAVFFRDRAICVLCWCDLSGTLLLSNEKNFDHIVPLADGGLNDVTNIQLLCSDCNSKKSNKEIMTSTNYEYWYPMEMDK